MTALELVLRNNVCMVNGSAGCVDADTEFFTGHGWKRIADYEQGDKVMQYNEDGTAELVEPLAYIKQPCDYLWHFETKYGVNQTICDQHNIIYWSQKGFKHECHIDEIIKEQSDVGKGWSGTFKTTFDYSGNGIDLTDEQIRVMCAVICDGSFYSYSKPGDNSYYTCRFHIKKDRKKERLRQLFAKAHIEWNEVQSANVDYTDFYIKAPLRTKTFGADWYNCSAHQLGIICDEIMFWDGNVNFTNSGTMRQRFSTSVKETADFVQFAYSACGFRATISVNDRRGQQYLTAGRLYTRKSVEYNVVVTNKEYVGICCDNRSDHVKTMPQKVQTTDGFKYCFTVPSHMLVLRRKDCVFVTGNCGKSQTTKAIVNMLDDMGLTYQLLAPTGIASKVLRNYTGRSAMTCHMFLLNTWQPDYIIMDEASICSVHLLAMLLDKIGYEPKLVFIADNAQLASIQCGSLVQDMIDSGIIPRVELTKIFRYNSSGIVTMATDIRHGACDHLGDDFPDYLFVPEDESNPIQQVVEQYDRLIAEGYGVDDIVVLCPFKKTAHGTTVINAALSAKYNPNKPVRKNSPLKIGDKVVNLKNCYDDGVDNMIANGDIGYLRNVIYSKKERSSMVMVEFDDGLRNVHSLSRIEPAMALTCHKMQGGSAKAIILYVGKSHDFFLTSNLLYVGVTRARERLVIVGNKDAIANGVKIQQNAERNTWLKEMLII